MGSFMQDVKEAVISELWWPVVTSYWSHKD
jgi:hypothetical protein